VRVSPRDHEGPGRARRGGGGGAAGRTSTGLRSVSSDHVSIHGSAELVGQPLDFKCNYMKPTCCFAGEAAAGIDDASVGYEGQRQGERWHRGWWSCMRWLGLVRQCNAPDASVKAAPMEPVAADKAAAAAEAAAWKERPRKDDTKSDRRTLQMI
jgi:hypothetical protein